MKVKKVPLRMCVGCSEHKPKKELIRIVRTPEGEVVIDFTGKKSGRGAYICRDIQCLRKAIKSKRIERTLEAPISQDQYDKLEEVLSQDGQQE